MAEPSPISWIEYVTAIGSVSTPILVLGLTAIGWQVRQRIQRRHDLEDKLRDDRIETYNQILEPFIILLMTDEAWNQDAKNRKKGKSESAIHKMLSLEYRKAAFKMSLVGSDEVVLAFNKLMQHFYHANYSEDEDTELATLKETTHLLGQFLLEIRRSMGNDATQLDAWSMIEWWLKDVYRFRDSESDV